MIKALLKYSMCISNFIAFEKTSKAFASKTDVLKKVLHYFSKKKQENVAL